ncbi:hypothetical protein ACCI51_06215 [Microbulbifer echini]|uniref:Uncharacterized protein n=1 Tax=Microbulbifer echini TaxID=1529067 RepID=A0ABV4NKN8_9GAMM
MPVCESVSILAKELEAALVDPTEPERKRLSALKKMPNYSSRKRLDLFDKAFTSAYLGGENEDAIGFKAIEILAELAFENMYVAFSKEDTLKTYKWSVEELSKLGVNVSKNLDMSEL